MNDQELKSLWSQQVLSPPVQTGDAELVARMKKKMRKFDRNIFWRDIREWAACVFVICWFSKDALQAGNMLSRVGCWVVVGSGIFIAAELIYTRLKFRSGKGSQPIREYLQAEARKVGRQIKLLESVLWWYILPIMVGAEMEVLGDTRDWGSRMAVTIVFIFVSVVLWWANRYAARKSLRPLKEELERTLNAVPEFSQSTEETN